MGQRSKLFALCALGATAWTLPAMADEVKLALNFGDMTRHHVQPAYPQIIDKTVFFVMDDSSSMKSDERLMMVNGILDAINSDEVKNSLDSGNYYRFVFVAFGSGAGVVANITVNNHKDAVHLIKDFFTDPATGLVKDTFGHRGGTHLDLGFAEVQRFLEQSLAEGVTSGKIDIVVMADAIPQDSNQAARRAKNLSGDFNARLSCIIFVNPNIAELLMTLINYYDGQIRSEEVEFIDRYGAKTVIPEGQCRPAQSTKGVFPVVNEALKLANG